MKPFATQQNQVPNQRYAEKIPIRSGDFDLFTIKGSQFQQPLLEFSGACAGCGETPYLKLITQLFGDRMIIANATGCSSIWGGSAPAVPFTVDKDGHGPAWANSLFEDNAEYGYGMVLATIQRRNKLADLIKQAIDENKVSDDTKEAFDKWLENKDYAEGSKEWSNKIKAALEKNHSDKILNQIWEERTMLTKKSIWSVGGDGWAYDIGYGGLDHVLAMGEDINILVFDTEVYSNTGGQASKATPIAAVAKFANGGMRKPKKNLGFMCMTYGDVYVASISLGANRIQALKAFQEAEAHRGPSIIIAYSPCIAHGIDMMKSQVRQKLAVECGYWPLYRYNPTLKVQGENPFILDSKKPDGSLPKFLDGEIRFASLKRTFPEEADKLQADLVDQFNKRYV